MKDLNKFDFQEKQIRLHDHPMKGGVEMFITAQTENELGLARILFEKHDPSLILEPTALLDPRETQQLFNELWRLGYRPSKPRPSDRPAGGSFPIPSKATQNHLNDMRKIVSKTLSVDL